MLSVSAHNPRSLPECRFLGPDSSISTLRMLWGRNCKKWMEEKPFVDNLAYVFGFQLPKPPEIVQRDNEAECGICYSQCLPLDDEVEGNRWCGIDYTCDNSKCSRGFHNLCLVEWLRSISTTRQSFDVLFGNCPYCCEPIAVKLYRRNK
ncbi:hypothetical protein SAY87_021325 [Trapa incisa]|uniref:E3 ubiquitin-protein ligase FANCL n=1 Tax=Trapa incisa TaxID=236973 RepID=A0AAN7JT41_9MYRT|nr:hypothetical protein SAY87_021325 [Trapa incisa]